jgi:hypothetical protein
MARPRRGLAKKLDGACRLPGEASPTKEAKEGQYNNDDDDDPKNRHVILSLGGGAFIPRWLVSGTWAGPRGEPLCSPRRRRQVGVERDQLDATHALRRPDPFPRRSSDYELSTPVDRRTINRLTRSFAKPRQRAFRALG